MESPAAAGLFHARFWHGAATLRRLSERGHKLSIPDVPTARMPTMKYILLATAASAAFIACSETEPRAMVTRYDAPRTEVLSAVAEPVGYTDTEYTLADLRGTGEVRDVFLRNGRVEGVVAGEGDAIRFVAYDELELTDDDGFGVELGEGDGEPMGRSVDDIVGTDVEVSGFDAPARLTDIVFERDGDIAYYVVEDDGEAVRVEPFKVALPALPEPEYEDAPDDYGYESDSYLPDRK